MRPAPLAAAAALLLLTTLAPAQPSTSALPSTRPASRPLPNLPSWRPDATIRILLVGDSTVTDSAGWGTGFTLHTSCDTQVINAAAGGRSSKSFLDEGRWAQALARGRESPGAYVLIQFGHNDQPGKGPDRETDPNTTYKANLLRYVQDARSAGLRPVLVTSLVRRNFKDDGRIRSNLTEYVEAAKAAARDANVPLLDLHQLSLDACNALGKAECERLSPKDPKTGKIDTTHLRGELAERIGKLVADELKKLHPELADHLTAEPFGTTVGPAGVHSTVIDAVAAAPAHLTRPYLIRIAPGTYKGHLVIPKDKPYLILRGTNASVTILTDDKNVNATDPAGNKLKTPDTSSTLVQTNDFTAEHITFENTAGNHGQAMALYHNADRAIFRNCRFLGWQDTLRLNSGRAYFEACYIEGHVDFIYSRGIAWFERCQIHAVADGYLTAASTEPSSPHGYVFSHCQVTAAPSVKRTYLGRPWRPYASVTFLHCELPAAVPPEGWHNWGKAENEKTARYAEYGNTGPGADTSRRVPWVRQLTQQEAEAITVNRVLAGQDNWHPW